MSSLKDLKQKDIITKRSEFYIPRTVLLIIQNLRI